MLLLLGQILLACYWILKMIAYYYFSHARLLPLLALCLLFKINFALFGKIQYAFPPKN